MTDAKAGVPMSGWRAESRGEGEGVGLVYILGGGPNPSSTTPQSPFLSMDRQVN